MYDKIDFGFDTQHIEYFRENICFNKSQSGSSDEPKYFNNNFYGLSVSMIENMVYVSGSLHKFYYGNNYTFFTKSDIEHAVKKLCKLLLIQPNEPSLKFTLLEFGINIPTECLPMQYAKLMLMYSNKGFYPSKPPRRSSKHYGTICNLSDYEFKFYDKYLQTLITFKGSQEEKQQLKKMFAESNLLRFEVVYRRVNKMPHLYNLSSLYSNDFLEFIVDDFTKKYERIIKKKILSISKMSPNEIILYHAGNDLQFWADFKTKSQSKFQEKRKEYDKILQKCGSNNLTDELGEKIQLMFFLLMEKEVSYNTNTYCVINNILTPILHTCNINVNRYDSNNNYKNDLIGV